MSLRKIVFIIVAAVIIPFSLTTNASKSHRKHTHKTAVHKKSKKAAKGKTAKLQQDEKTEADKSEKATDKTLAANVGEVSGETVVKTAMRYLGVPYRRGNSSPKGFDCSGFTSYVYKQFDIALAHNSGSQFSQGVNISDKSKLRAGDLVFFKGSNGRGGIGHVGIVTEVNPENKTFSFVHASRNGIAVDNSQMAYYSKRYMGACRVLSGDINK